MWCTAICTRPMQAHLGVKEFKAIHCARSLWTPQRVLHWKIYYIYSTLLTPSHQDLAVNTSKAQWGVYLITVLLHLAKKKTKQTFFIISLIFSALSPNYCTSPTHRTLLSHIWWSWQVLLEGMCQWHEEKVTHNLQARHFCRKVCTTNSWLGGERYGLYFPGGDSLHTAACSDLRFL